MLNTVTKIEPGYDVNLKKPHQTGTNSLMLNSDAE